MKRHELITEILKLTGHKRSLHPDVHFGIDRLLRKYEEARPIEREKSKSKQQTEKG